MESVTDRISVEDINKQMSEAYVDYAMSVIVNRALPDVRDGLKPVHRRIMYAMEEGGYGASKAYKKSARIVGDVMGKYHPHGDSAIYETMVRMAQPWSLRQVLIDGQGNFGSMDGDSAAAMRYTEARMSRLAHELTADIDKNTVAFRPTYDGSNKEPVVLPARFPNLLVNGGQGIAVGMATNIPTHNLGEAIDACLLVLSNPSATLDEVMAVLPGPDFPTKGVIYGRNAIREAYATGRGSIPMSGVAEIEEGKRGKTAIIITELPYQLNKAEYIEKVAELVNEKKIEGITDIRDESDRTAMCRIVIDVKADADPHVILNALRRHTRFQTSFGYNATCLSSRGEPKEMPLLEILKEFIAFRRQVVTARVSFELDKTRDQQVRQIGLFAAVSDIDEVVRLIRSSADKDDARVKLMNRDFAVDDELAQLIREADPDATPGDTFRLNEVQADAILGLSLSSLTGLERDRIAEKLRGLAGDIRGLAVILEDTARLDGVVRQELAEIREKYATPRMTRIEASLADDIDDDSLIERKDVIVTLTASGYVKRTEVSAYRAQRRGGKGKTGMETKDDDYVVGSVVCTTRSPLLVFTSRGQVYAIKTWRLPEAAANAKGRPIVNFIELRAGEKVSALVPLPEDRSEIEHLNLVFVTDFGSVRRNRISDFLDLRKGGKIAMRLEDESGSTVGRLVAVLPAGDGEDVLVATASGTSIRFPVEDLRIFSGRDSTGVRAISLKDRDTVVDACILAHTEATPLERDIYLLGGSSFVREKDLLNDRGERRELPATITLTPAPEAEKPDRLMATLSPVRMGELRAEERFLLTVTAGGYGKRSSTHEYRITSRGGSGVAAAVINDTTGNLVACLLVEEQDGLVLVTDGGQAIRTRVGDVGILGRTTRGVRLLSVPDGQKIVGVARVPAVADPDQTEDQTEG